MSGEDFMFASLTDALEYARKELGSTREHNGISIKTIDGLYELIKNILQGVRSYD